MLRVAEYFQHSDTGRARPVNEDAVFARPPLFAVADGMGGAQAGEVASSAAVAELDAGLPTGKGSIESRLATLVAKANERVHELSQADAEKAGMGTTLTVVYLSEDDLAVAHVGDSRLYQLRDGKLEQATDDHSLVGELVRRGQLSPEEAEDHPQRSIITRALGPEVDVDVDHHTIAANDGDLFLLCSDGLTSMVGDEQIAEIVAAGKSLEKTGKALVKAANQAGGRDNISVVLFRVEEVVAGADPLADQATGVIDAAELEAAAAAVRQAKAERLAKAAPGEDDGDEVDQRAPRPPRQKSTGRPALRGVAKGLAVTAIVLALVGTAAVLATRSVYFVGTDKDGFVTIYRGLPYNLTGGFSTYSREYQSGVSVSALPDRLRKTVVGHELRSRDDAADLVRQLEQGKIAGQQ
jgi:serine/threonine protein phosphatase PrpC